jgi:type IV pilus assembly protein PilB
MSEELREMVLAGASAGEVKRTAINVGMMTLRQSGLLKIKQGMTTTEEVLRVTMPD